MGVAVVQEVRFLGAFLISLYESVRISDLGVLQSSQRIFLVYTVCILLLTLIISQVRWNTAKQDVELCIVPLLRTAEVANAPTENLREVRVAPRHLTLLGTAGSFAQGHVNGCKPSICCTGVLLS